MNRRAFVVYGMSDYFSGDLLRYVHTSSLRPDKEKIHTYVSYIRIRSFAIVIASGIIIRIIMTLHIIFVFRERWNAR